MVSLASNGRIVNQGSFADVIEKDEALAATFAKEQEILKREVVEVEEVKEEKANGSGKLVMAEEISVGHVSWAACMGTFPFRMHWVQAHICSSQAVPRCTRWCTCCLLLGCRAYFIRDHQFHVHIANLVPGLLGNSIRRSPSCRSKHWLVSVVRSLE